jgi:mannitol/fructose-specific phosphotransferase system IIA component (Ntr-type)
MLLSEIFAVDRIKVDLMSKTKVELFHELIELLEENGAITDADRVMKALWQRESVMNTLVAPHIALPHASVWLFKKTVGAFGISHEGIDYGTPNEKPVNIVMLLIDDRYEADKHLAILKKTARLIGSPNFYSKIMACDDPRQVYELIVEMEELQRL